jgi:hypothetical protein
MYSCAWNRYNTRYSVGAVPCACPGSMRHPGGHKGQYRSNKNKGRYEIRRDSARLLSGWTGTLQPVWSVRATHADRRKALSLRRERHFLLICTVLATRARPYGVSDSQSNDKASIPFITKESVGTVPCACPLWDCSLRMQVGINQTIGPLPPYTLHHVNAGATLYTERGRVSQV